MSLVVLAYPQLEISDTTWIERVRSKYDPQSSFVKAHVTLVFPTDSLQPAGLSAHARRCLAGEAAFNIGLRYAIVAANAFSGDYHVFLVPDQGLSNLWRLHDRLYTGPLAPARRHDIPFIPHITVAGGHSAAACQRLADELNQEPVAINGRIACVTVAAIGDAEITKVDDIWLD